MLSSVYLWCLVHQKKVLACAPTGAPISKWGWSWIDNVRIIVHTRILFVFAFPGIAASNIEVERTGVRAVTIHNAFELDQTLHTKLDMSNMEKTKVKELHRTDVLMIDEISMMVGG